MVNPFSGFLTPSFQPIQGSPSWSELENMSAGQRREGQQRLENEQQNSRANAYLKLQQDQQARGFAKDDQKEIEGLIAEYQNAAAKGDPAQIADVVQRLKRFGMDVSQAQPSTQRMAPSLDPLSHLQDFTQEPATSQQDFEEQLINSSQAAGANDMPEPDIAGHLASVGPLKALKLNTPEEQAAQSEVVDLDQEPGATPLQVGEESAPPQLATQTLPNVTTISKGGKKLYESSSQGRYSPLVSSVFSPLTKHQDPEVAQAAQRAQGLAEKLVTVDGVSPREAIEFATKRFENETAGMLALQRTTIGSRRGGGAGGAGTGLMGKTQDIAESIQVYDDNARQAATKLEEEDRQYETIEAKANSGDPTMVRDAINELMKIRSGTAVSAAEDARISQINGLLPKIQDMVGRWTGGPPSPELVRYIQQVAQMKRAANAAKRKRIFDHQASLYEAQNSGKTKDPEVLRKRAEVLRQGGASSAPDPEESLY